MYLREKEVVNKEFVRRPDTYNLKIGGDGGYDHLNDGSRAHRDRCSRAAKNRIIQHGNPGIYSKFNFATSPEHHKRAINLARAPEARLKLRIALQRNNHQQGSKNSQYGMTWCIPSDAIDLSNKKRFKEIPDGWISTTQWRESRKDKTGTYGRKWYNDGTNNFLLSVSDERIKSLSKGRLMAGVKRSSIL